MGQQNVAARAARELVDMTHLPPSFDGNPWLYASALTSVMCIACLGIAVAVWMARDVWRDRYISHPKSLLFLFRMMMGLAGFAAFTRSMPEVLYLQVYGDPDVSATVQGAITTAKRVADSLALWLVLGWMLILVAIYPAVCVALKTPPARFVEVDALSTWPRLGRPILIFVIIAGLSIAFAYAKVYGG